MNYQIIADFDSTPYTSSVNFTLGEGIVLGRNLRTLTPKTAPNSVKEAGLVLDTLLDECDAAVVERTRGDTSAIEASVLDYTVDGAWLFVTSSLTRWTYLQREGLDVINQDKQLRKQIDVDSFNAKIEAAADLHERMFGVGGTSGLKQNFAEQAHWMANILRLIEQDDLGEQLGETVTGEIVPFLHACQRAYEAMVQLQLRQPVDVANLRRLRNTLQRVINFYSSAVVGMIITGGAEAIPVVEAALYPIVALRARRAKSSSSGGASSQANEAAPVEPADDGNAVSDAGDDPEQP